jgi:hypothetical protein
MQHCIAREARRRAGVHVMADGRGVFGAFAFTRAALRDADLEKCEGYLRRHPGRQRQGVVPDLQIGTALYELKGIHTLGSQPLQLQLQGCAGDRSGEEGG